MNPTGVLRRLYGLSRVLRLHRPDNDAVARVLDALETDLQAFHDERGTLLLQVLTGEIFVNRQLVRPDATSRPLFDELAHVLQRLGVEAIAFLPGVSRHSLDSFAHQVASGALEPSRVGHIRVAPTSARRGLRRLLSPEEQGRQVFAAVARAFDEVAAAPGEVPLRALSRSLLLASELSEDAPGVFRGMRLSGSSPQTQLAVQRAMASLQIAASMDLASDDRLALGLAATLGVLLPEECGASWLLRFRGLGSLGARVVVAVHERRTAASAAEAGVLAQVLALSAGDDSIVDPALRGEWAPSRMVA